MLSKNKIRKCHHIYFEIAMNCVHFCKSLIVLNLPTTFIILLRYNSVGIVPFGNNWSILISDFIPSVKLCGQYIEVVSDEFHLGNHIYNDIYRKQYYEFVGDFYCRSNHIISHLNMCDSITLNHLHATYCTSMYGCELLQHNAKYMSQLYVAWRKSIRRVFRLPS